MSDRTELDNEELIMISQYVQNQQEVIEDLMKKNMQLTTEIQVQRIKIKQLESLNKEEIKSKKRFSAFKQERLGILKDVLNK